MHAHPPPAPSGTQEAPRDRLFDKLAQTLRERLHNGHYPQGIPLPGERELAQEFAVARITVRSALQRLQEQGLVTRLRGLGTLPVQQPSTADHSKIRSGLLGSIVSFGLRTRIRLESATTLPASGEVAHALGLAPSTPVLRVVRVRTAQRQALLCTEAYLPPDVAALLDATQLDDEPLLTAIERAGRPFAQGEQELSAVTADAEVARRLGTVVGAPVLRVHRVVYDEAGQPIQYLIGHYEPTHYRYRMKMSRTGGTTQVWIVD